MATTCHDSLIDHTHFDHAHTKPRPFLPATATTNDEAHTTPQTLLPGNANFAMSSPHCPWPQHATLSLIDIFLFDNAHTKPRPLLLSTATMNDHTHTDPRALLRGSPCLTGHAHFF
ncbi:hypothetical protein HispidOSU_011704 [Sigmodon hispidus]